MTDTAASPFVSVVMPVFETPGDLLRQSIASVLNQSFRDLELIAVDDGSKSTEVTEILAEMARSDDRLRVIRRETNGGIVAASNDGLRAASGVFVTFVDHDDLIEPEAFKTCVDVLRRNDDCDLLYTDEARVDENGEIVSPFLKPDWSPERLRSQNYVNHLSLYRRSLVEEIGGFRTGFDGSQDYDLVLRVSERARKVLHIPQVLYHWRLVPGQVSGTGDPAVYDAARRAIEEHCARTGRPGWVEQIHPLGVYRVHRQIVENPSSASSSRLGGRVAWSVVNADVSSSRPSGASSQT